MWPQFENNDENPTKDYVLIFTILLGSLTREFSLESIEINLKPSSVTI